MSYNKDKSRYIDIERVSSNWREEDIKLWKIYYHKSRRKRVLPIYDTLMAFRRISSDVGCKHPTLVTLID